MVSRKIQDPSKSKFDIEIARRLLYLGKEARDRFQAGPGKTLSSVVKVGDYNYTVIHEILFSQIFFFKKTLKVFGFIAQHDNDIFVIFRGSQTPGDWISNARFYQSWKSLGVEKSGQKIKIPGQIHKGFKVQYSRTESNLEEGKQSVSESIRTAFDQHFSEGQSIYIAGHSLGGALATLAAAELRVVYEQADIYLYTSASPRVGNSEFEDFIDGESQERETKKINAFRIVNTIDLVPQMPLRFESPNEGPKYVHVGEPIAFANRVDKPLPEKIEYQHTLPIYACALGLDPEDFRYDMDKPLPFKC